VKIVVKGQVLVKEAPEKIIKKLQDDLTYRNPEYDDAVKNGRFISHTLRKKEFLRYYQMRGNSIIIPRAMVGKLLNWTNFPQQQVIDYTVAPEIDIEFTGKLRDYQEHAVADMLRKRYGVLEAATGAGKTVMGINYVCHRKLKTLILVHNKELFNQWPERFEQFTNVSSIGRIGDGKCEIGDVTVGIINSVEKRLEELKNEFGIVIFDECFPAGTLVDNKPIETIQIGDYVKSYSHATGTIQLKKVTRLFKKQTPDTLYEIQLSNGEQIVCTPNHPFFTDKGYLTADQLCANSTVYRTIKQHKGEYDETEMHMPQMQESHNSGRTSKSKANQEGLSRMQSTTEVCGSALQSMRDGSETNTMESKKWCTLFGQMCENYISEVKEEKRKIPNKIQQGFGETADVDKQPNEKPRGCRENENHKTRERDPECVERETWGERALDSTAREVGCCPWLGNRSSSGAWETSEWVPLSVQNRCGEQETKSGHRGRWERACQPQKTSPGQKENRKIEPIRVENITVHKRGSGQQFERLCKDGFVYNIEVEDNHNYFVHDILVHNCHRILGDMWVQAVSALRPRFHIGMSATPYRRQRHMTKAIFCLLGPMLHKVDNQHLIDTGAVLNPRIIRRNTRFRTSDTNMNYTQIVGHLVRDEARNTQIANDIIEEYKRYKEPIMVVSDRVTHCEALKYLIDGFRGIKPLVLNGRLPKNYRERAVQEMKQGHYNVLIATVSLLGEGFDAPDLNSIFLTTPIKFQGRTLQTIGRILRPSDGGQPRVYDYRDIGSKVIRNSGFARDRIYRDKGWTA
jgi:superfamily II DNA or RNA helicase